MRVKDQEVRIDFRGGKMRMESEKREEELGQKVQVELIDQLFCFF